MAVRLLAIALFALGVVALASCQTPVERPVFISEKTPVAVAVKAPRSEAVRPTFSYGQLPVDSALEEKLKAAFNDLAAWVAYALRMEPVAKPGETVP